MILGYKNKTDLTSFGLNLMAVIVLIRGWKMFKLKKPACSDGNKTLLRL